jgi:hypothetical protein
MAREPTIFERDQTELAESEDLPGMVEAEMTDEQRRYFDSLRQIADTEQE